MLVINEADVEAAMPAKVFEDGEWVLGLADPAAVIVEANGAADFRGGLSNLRDALGLEVDAGLLRLRAGHWLTAARDPELRAQPVTFQHVEDEPGLVVQRSGKPPCQQRNVMAL